MTINEGPWSPRNLPKPFPETVARMEREERERKERLAKLAEERKARDPNRLVEFKLMAPLRVIDMLLKLPAKQLSGFKLVGTVKAGKPPAEPGEPDVITAKLLTVHGRRSGHYEFNLCGKGGEMYTNKRSEITCGACLDQLSDWV